MVKTRWRKYELRKLRSRKAMSPVIAAIILIAVTVAVSIAVAAWMGALSISFMGGTEQLDIQHITWSTDPDTFNITLTVKNMGTSKVTIDHIKANNVQVSSNASLSSIDAGETETYGVSYPWVEGDYYDIAVVTSRGTAFPERFTGGVNV